METDAFQIGATVTGGVVPLWKLLVAGSTGVLTHFAKEWGVTRMPNAPEDPVTATDYFVRNKPQMLTTVLTTGAFIFFGSEDGSMTTMAAWLAGVSGGSFGDMVGRRVPKA